MIRLVYIALTIILQIPVIGFSQLPIKKQIEIFQNKYLSSPDASIQIGNESILYVKNEDPKKYSEDYVCKLIMLERFGNDWGEVNTTILWKGERASLSNFKFVTIENKKYLYFEEFVPGGSSGNSGLIFTLYDINSN